jgi:hypothetical protein
MRALTDSIALVEQTTRRIRVSSIDGGGPGGGRVDQLRLVQKAPIACFVPFRNANRPEAVFAVDSPVINCCHGRKTFAFN